MANPFRDAGAIIDAKRHRFVLRLSSIRRVTRNVKRWQNGSMVRRWVGLRVAHAQTKFRKKGYANLPALVLALRGKAQVADETEAA